MPAVFVHGVPDTQHVWDAVISRLGRKDVVTLSLPGFGCTAPSGFSSTKEAYVEWLLAQLAAIQGPIDLVGHDWGGLLVVRAVVLWGEKDPYAAVEFGGRLAEKTRARFVSFRACSHWWQLERPTDVTAELERFWGSI